jgi:hypothetical protein
MPSEEVKMPRVEKMITNKGTTLLTSAMTAGISSEDRLNKGIHKTATVSTSVMLVLV